MINEEFGKRMSQRLFSNIPEDNDAAGFSFGIDGQEYSDDGYGSADTDEEYSGGKSRGTSGGVSGGTSNAEESRMSLSPRRTNPRMKGLDAIDEAVMKASAGESKRKSAFQAVSEKLGKISDRSMTRKSATSSRRGRRSTADELTDNEDISVDPRDEATTASRGFLGLRIGGTKKKKKSKSGKSADPDIDRIYATGEQEPFEYVNPKVEESPTLELETANFHEMLNYGALKGKSILEATKIKVIQKEMDEDEEDDADNEDDKVVDNNDAEDEFDI